MQDGHRVLCNRIVLPAVGPDASKHGSMDTGSLQKPHLSQPGPSVFVRSL